MNSLQQAIHDNNINQLRLMLELGYNPNAESKRWKSPLMEALLACNEEAARLLLDYGAHTGGLIFRLIYYEEKALQLLLKLGVNVNERDRLGYTALGYVRNTNSARTLVMNGAKVNTKNITGNTPLMTTADRDLKELTELFITHGAKVNARNCLEQTALFAAAKNGNTEVGQILINHGAMLNARDYEGRTALFQAIKNKQEKFVRLLIKHGAKINIIDRYGNTPLFTALRNGRENIIKILLECGADVNRRHKEGYTPLQLVSTSHNFKELASLLQKYGADAQIVNSFGETPEQRFNNPYYDELYTAIINKETEKVGEILQKPVDINEINLWGRTFLFYAVEFSNPEIIILLLDHGADPDLLPLSTGLKFIPLKIQIENLKIGSILSIILKAKER